MQYIGIKIQHLLDVKGLKQKILAEKMRIGERHISKKIGKELKFSPSQIAIAADFLGVTESYLRDTTPIHSTTPSDLADMVRIFERQAADMEKSKNAIMETEFHAMKEMQRQMAEILKEITGNNRVTSETLLEVVGIVRELKDERDGGHDPD